ncbi:MAG: hypothetical protein LBE13_00790, partial [Bacteroidales bacterium]|nr:hypothetical protein [Bacteroidales bacterium]
MMEYLKSKIHRAVVTDAKKPPHNALPAAAATPNCDRSRNTPHNPCPAVAAEKLTQTAKQRLSAG